MKMKKAKQKPYEAESKPLYQGGCHVVTGGSST